MDVVPPILTETDPRHEAAAGSLLDLPFNDEEFAFVFCTEVLEHIEDDVRALQEIRRVLRPGGLVLLATPTPPAPRDPAHVREGYTLEDFRQKLASAGLELLDHTYCFHLAMRLLSTSWRWLYDLGTRPKSRMPRALALALAYRDRWLPLGPPFDIVALGRKP